MLAFKKFQAIFVRKNFILRSPLVLKHLCVLTSTSEAKNAAKSWNLFTKRVLVEKHISSIMYKNLDRQASLSPSVDAHDYCKSKNLCEIKAAITQNEIIENTAITARKNDHYRSRA